MQDSIYDVTALLAWRCHRQRRHDVVFWTTKTTLNSDYLLKIKAWEKNNQSQHSGMDKGIPSSCPWFATSTTRQASLWIANHGHSDGIPLSIPECSDRFYYSTWFVTLQSFSHSDYVYSPVTCKDVRQQVNIVGRKIVAHSGLEPAIFRLKVFRFPNWAT